MGLSNFKAGTVVLRGHGTCVLGGGVVKLETGVVIGIMLITLGCAMVGTAVLLLIGSASWH